MSRQFDYGGDLLLVLGGLKLIIDSPPGVGGTISKVLCTVKLKIIVHRQTFETDELIREEW